MEFFNSKRFIIIMLIVLVWAGLSGCSPTEYADKQAPHETEQEMNAQITKEMEAMDKEKAQEETPGPTNFEGIADVLGCMFAPDNCPLKKRQEERKLDR
tara:strand:+ start:381 stop:677 length:297 start_codon:yes stop_codon:yes gene_type:complete